MIIVLLEMMTLFASPPVLSQVCGMALPLASGLFEVFAGARDGAICVALSPFVLWILGVNWDASLAEQAPEAGITPPSRPRSPETVRAAVAALRCR